MDNLQQIRDLFKDSTVRDRLRSAHSPDEALGIVVGAGAAKGVSFTAQDLSKTIGVLSSSAKRELSDAELSTVAGGLRSVDGDTGHTHMSCCTDCPVGGGLC